MHLYLNQDVAISILGFLWQLGQGKHPQEKLHLQRNENHHTGMPEESMYNKQ